MGTSRWWKRLLTAGLLLVLAAATLEAVIVPAWLVRRETKRWSSAGLPFQPLVEGWSAREAPDEQALALETLAAGLGADLRPRRATRAATPLAPGPDWAEVKRLSRSGDPGDATLSGPSPHLARWLDDHDAAIDSLVERILSGDAPKWERSAAGSLRGVLPNLLGHARIHQLLALRALRLGAAGDDAGALRCCEASWRLRASLEEESELVQQLILCGILQGELLTLRRLDGVPQSWETGLAEVDPRAAMRSALVLGAYRTLVAVRAGGREVMRQQMSFADEPLELGLRFAVFDPYNRWNGLVAARTSRRALVAIARVEPCAVLDPDFTPWPPPDEKRRLWVDLTGMPEVHAIARATHATLNAEMTRLVLETRRIRREHGLEAARALPELIPSIACPEHAWRRHVDADGRIRVAWSGPEPASPDEGAGGYTPLDFAE